MIIDETDYIEHFGVRGMHWGVRKQRTEKEKSSRNKKIAIAGAGATVIGAIFVSSFLKKHGASSPEGIRRKNRKMVEEFNRNARGLYERGIIWDAQGLGRGPGEIWP